MKSFDEFLEEKENSDLFEMSNLWSSRTGLDEVIWVSVKNANHGPRIKVYQGNTLSGPNFTVTIEDEPQVIGDCFVKTKELNRIFEFIQLNKENLVKYWNYQIDTVEMVGNIHKVK